jgi:hypothetical protein
MSADACAPTRRSALRSIPESLWLEGRAKQAGGVLWGSLETVASVTVGWECGGMLGHTLK